VLVGVRPATGYAGTCAGALLSVCQCRAVPCRVTPKVPTAPLMMFLHEAACLYWSPCPVKHSLKCQIDQLHEEIVRRAKDGEESVRIYLRALVAQVSKEYGAIHADFRHNVAEALQTFGSVLETSLKACQLYHTLSGLVLPHMSGE
jgi:hypothetical protein